MEKDKRIRQLAVNVLKNSIGLKKGERVYIEGIGNSVSEAMQEFISVAIELGAVPFYFFNDTDFLKNLIAKASKEQIEEYGKIHADTLLHAETPSQARILLE